MAQPRSTPGTFRGAAVVLAAALVLAPGCRKRGPAGPDWATSAPASTVMAVSGRAGWLLEQKTFQTTLEASPFVEQALDLFLTKAHINPHGETGRLTLYVFNVPGDKAAPEVLLQLGGFKDQAAVRLAIADAFPSEGSLPVGKRELPVYVILDINAYHIRAVADPAGRVWLGDLRSLARLSSGTFPARSGVLSAAEWINGEAPFQGFLRPSSLLGGLSGRVPAEWARNLPAGLEALAWSVTPGKAGPGGLHRFELAITGSPEGVVQVAPWVQRVVAAAAALPGNVPPQAPEILQEKHRIGLRCELTGDQINQALAKLSQPGISFHLPRP